MTAARAPGLRATVAALRATWAELLCDSGVLLLLVAAPVVVGIMEAPAVRARRKSLCDLSRMD